MCDCIALTWRDLPDAIISEYGLRDRIVTPQHEADRQIHFPYRKHPRLMPVWFGGQLRILPWGNGSNRKLPSSGICKQESLDDGKWSYLRPQPVEIPAPIVQDGGRWFDIRQGMKGIVVSDPQNNHYAYLLTEPASHYYQNMTRKNRMPVFIGKDF